MIAGVIAGGRPYSASGAPAIPTAGLVAWYKMDSISGGVLVDETGDHPGTISNATLVEGKLGSAIKCNGSNTLGSIPHSSTLDLAVFSLSLWVKFTTTQNFVIAEKNGNSGWSLQTTNSAFVGNFGGSVGQVALNAGGISATLRSGVSINTGSWVHVAVTVDFVGGVNRIYVNGSLTSPSSGPGSSVQGVPIYVDGPLALGARPPTVGPYNGAIDNFRYYNRVLSASEVAALYAET